MPKSRPQEAQHPIGEPITTGIPLTHRLSAALALRPRTFKATLALPATDTSSGRRYRIDLDAAETAELRAVADAFGMSLATFLRVFLFRRLPGQLQRSAKREAAAAAAPARFECSDPATMRRIERAAFFYGQTVERFIMELIAHDLEGQEAECWIVHPATKEPLISRPRLNEMLNRGREYLEPLKPAAVRATVTAPCVAAAA